jgi:hypothetical protein
MRVSTNPTCAGYLSLRRRDIAVPNASTRCHGQTGLPPVSPVAVKTAAEEEILPLPPRSRSKVPPHPSGSAP